MTCTGGWGPATIDGELTVADPDGRPDFYGLTDAMRRRKRDLMFEAFDLLEIDGKDIRSEPLERRRELLADLLERSGIGCACFSKAFGDGPALLKARRTWVGRNCLEASRRTVLGRQTA